MENAQIIYVGDPMCSWCYGIAPHLKKLKVYASENDVNFVIVVGGLRPGGGEEWNEEMKQFLKHHWEEVNSRSGQPFGYKLFKKETFDYDTEPACRAIVAFRSISPGHELAFFEDVQRKFYVESADPSSPDFYGEICDKYSVDFQEFIDRWTSAAIRQKTYEEFTLNRQWGVRGYPTLLLFINQELHLIANGYAEYEELKRRVEMLVEKANS